MDRGGRDHYGELTPLMLYGGGLKMGQVIGSSDSRADPPSSGPTSGWTGPRFDQSGWPGVSSTFRPST